MSLNKYLIFWSYLFFLFLGGLQAETENSSSILSFRENKHDAVILTFLDYLYQQKYNSADSVLNLHLDRGQPGYYYFKGFLECTIFNDFGDTSALFLAKNYWEKLGDLAEDKPQKKKDTLFWDLYHGLALSQLGYVSSILHKSIKSAFQGRAGVKLLGTQKQFLEAQCVIQIYKYYKNKLFSWVPLVNDNQKPFRKFLLDNYEHSRYLSVFFLTPLIWMHFDVKMYQKGLELAQKFLKKYPDNRIYRLIEADFYYKLKNYDKASQIFEEIKSEYLNFYSNSSDNKFIRINYFSAVGNLVRVYKAWGNAEKQKENSDIWFSEDCIKVRKWLPKSLIKDIGTVP
jgi:tetratricopeptide (TPR) repeat protein